jgi:hypothetical protein
MGSPEASANVAPLDRDHGIYGMLALVIPARAGIQSGGGRAMSGAVPAPDFRPDSCKHESASRGTKIDRNDSFVP